MLDEVVDTKVASTSDGKIDDKINDKVDDEIKLTLKSVSIVGTWKFDIENDKCALCHHNLMDPSQNAIKNRKIKNNVIIGKCTHAFHEDCINKWTQHGNLSCTVCKTLWNPMKNVGTSVGVYKSMIIPTESDLNNMVQSNPQYKKLNIVESVPNNAPNNAPNNVPNIISDVVTGYNIASEPNFSNGVASSSSGKVVKKIYEDISSDEDVPKKIAPRSPPYPKKINSAPQPKSQPKLQPMSDEDVEDEIVIKSTSKSANNSVNESIIGLAKSIERSQAIMLNVMNESKPQKAKSKKISMQEVD